MALPLPLIALVTKMRSPQTTGLECARPGIGVRQRMPSFEVAFHVSGRSCPFAIPVAFGPRKDGQLPVAGLAAGNAGVRSGPDREMVRVGTASASPSGRQVLSLNTIWRGTQASATVVSMTREPSTLYL